MDDLTQRSKVKLNYELPDEVVEDYTYEMGRLKFKVNIQLFPEGEVNSGGYIYRDAKLRGICPPFL